MFNACQQKGVRAVCCVCYGAGSGSCRRTAVIGCRSSCYTADLQAPPGAPLLLLLLLFKSLGWSGLAVLELQSHQDEGKCVGTYRLAVQSVLIMALPHLFLGGCVLFRLASSGTVLSFLGASYSALSWQ